MKTLVWDLLIIAGGLALAVGFGLAWLPLGVAVAGGELLALGMLGAWTFGSRQNPGDQK